MRSKPVPVRRIPIGAARDIAQTFKQRQVILLAWDGERTHVVTYGVTKDDCSQAAEGGNLLKQKWGWPECNAQPSRVRRLEEENAKLKRQIRVMVQFANCTTTQIRELELV